MNVAIVCAPDIKCQTWIETSLIDMLFELDPPTSFLLGNEFHRANKIIANFLKVRHYSFSFSNSTTMEVGYCPQTQLYNSFDNIDFAIILHDGISLLVDRAIQVAIARKIELSLRYYNEEKTMHVVKKLK